MKRVKMMLLSFALLAVVGGALAFKAKYGSLDFCYTTTTITQTPLCRLTLNSLEVDNGLRFTYYTTPSVFIEGIGDQCIKEANNQTPLTCTTKIEVTKD
jgi:hypothetical protein